MQAKVFCKTVAKGIQAYYVTVDGNSIYLFQQNYRVSNKEFFSNGVGVHALGKFRNVHSTSVRNTLEKIPYAKVVALILRAGYKKLDLILF